MPKKDDIISIYTDGACSNNPGKGAWSYIFVNEQNEIYSWGGGYLDNTTNNRAEYRAIINALREVPYNSRVRIYSDSELVIKQIKQEYRVSSEQLKELYDELFSLSCKSNCQYFHVFRSNEFIRVCDALCSKIKEFYCVKKGKKAKYM